MKTLTINIDEATVKRLDRLIASKAGPWKNRSELICHAVQRLLEVMIDEEERELDIFYRASSRLNRQVAALIKEQAGNFSG